MRLVFIGIDPETGDKQSPTVWVDTDAKEIVFQGWKPPQELEDACASTEIAGHATGIPDNEAVVRIPARMVHMIREACDAVERSQLR
ncbi:hypothetical protein ACL02R_27920 [Streptomyces sp. MS19]|uniref:hypothetical protein n=1 Tax=Streptomyces sp. MS19 TaxID=3385972 RepID=UPI00399EFEF3